MVLRGLLVVCLFYSAAILIDPFEELADFLTGIVFPSFRKEEGGLLFHTSQCEAFEPADHFPWESDAICTRSREGVMWK